MTAMQNASESTRDAHVEELLQREFTKVEAPMRQLKDIAVQRTRFDLETRHRIGRILIGMSRETGTWELLGVPRRINLFEEFAKEVGLHPRLLSECVHFVRAYDEAQLVQLLDSKVCWTCVRVLLDVPSESLRAKLLTEAIDERLTADELARRALQRREAPKAKPGRQPKPPRNMRHAVTRLLSETQRCLTAYEGSLFNDEYDLASDIRSSPNDDLSDSFCAELAEGVGLLRALATKATAEAERMEQALAHVETVLANRRNEPAIPARS